MNFSDLLTNVRRIIEDDGLRWSDTPIAEYLVEGVNEIFRKTGGVTDTIPFNFAQGTSEYEITTDGRITTVKVLPENSVTPVTLNQIQVEEIPVDFTDQADPTAYALSQVDTAGTLGSTQMILFNKAPARTATGAFFVDVSREWSFTSDAVATTSPDGGQAGTVIPVLPKFDRHLTNFVAGSLLTELNDNQLAQRGLNMVEIAKKYISDRAYVDSISHFTYTPRRPFP